MRRPFSWLKDDLYNLHNTFQQASQYVQFKKTSNVGKTRINHPMTGNGSYHLFMVIWGMVCYCFIHININMFFPRCPRYVITPEKHSNVEVS